MKLINQLLILFLINYAAFSQINESVNSAKLNEEIILYKSFNKANQLYIESRYEESILEYLVIINQGFHSSETYFNLGNCYYKLNDIPNAILYFERALKLNPSDSDILNNLKMVNNSIIDETEKIPNSFINLKSDQISSFFHINIWSGILIFLSFLSLTVFIIFNFSQKPITKRLTFFTSIIIGFMIILSFNFSFISYNKNYKTDYAIVFSPEVMVKLEPNEKSDNIKVLYQGYKIKIIEKFADEWLKVKLGSGKEGWIKQNKIKII